MRLSFFGPERNKTAWIVAGVVGLATLVTLVWQLGIFGDSTDALAASTSREDRQKAIRKLAESGSSDAAEKLTKLASHSDPWTARYAVRAMGDRPSDENRRALTGILANREISAAARSEAAATLGKFKQADPVVLVRSLTADESPEVRAGAAKGLARLEKPSTIPQLSAALEDPSPQVRMWAITAIHKMIVRRYPYDPAKPPQQQQEVIGRIREYLRKCGVL